VTNNLDTVFQGCVRVPVYILLHMPLTCYHFLFVQWSKFRYCIYSPLFVLLYCSLNIVYYYLNTNEAQLVLLLFCSLNSMLLSEYKWGTINNFLVLFFKYGVVKVKFFMYSWCYFNLLAAEYYIHTMVLMHIFILTAGYWRRGLVDARWKHNVINYMVMWF
jgi:hypothetical protein